MHLPQSGSMLEKRATRYCSYSAYRGYYNCRSNWSHFGRWILAGVLIAIALLFLLLILNRRRRRQARNFNTGPPPAPQPMSEPGYNTASYPGNGAPNYAPPQGPPPGAGANADYYGNGGMQQPQGAYMKT